MRPDAESAGSKKIFFTQGGEFGGPGSCRLGLGACDNGHEQHEQHAQRHHTTAPAES
jgi:hypothetical protein